MICSLKQTLLLKNKLLIIKRIEAKLKNKII